VATSAVRGDTTAHRVSALIPEEEAMDISDIAFDAHGLVPCVVQEWSTGEVLMLAYMNRESVARTLATGTTWFWSRSRSALWNKGETSGHVQHVRELRFDCDADALLALVDQTGPACHTGDTTCFDGRLLSEPAATGPLFATLTDLARTIAQRKGAPTAGSYTARLFEGGVDSIGAKVEEEAGEVVEAASAGDVGHTVYEAGDVLYHLLVLLAHLDIPLSDVMTELERRKG
jgi:phosphoribosyl-ATP pyrophosphohydrolase/phosphoribosyl-AMP cyclohydrolase